MLPLVPYPSQLQLVLDTPGCPLFDGGTPDPILSDSSDLPSEAYRLKIHASGVEIAAGSEAGFFYGRQTLEQLVAYARRTATDLPNININDHPRFSWRGAHLDVCRHFFPLDFIKRFIDLLAFHKLNIFHWHLTEDQGWRLELKQYPKLTEISAWREEADGTRYGGFYTQDEAREIVAYAAERHIQVIPEIEIPGHAIAALAAYPEYSCTGEPLSVETEWGIFDDVYCPGKEKTFEFLQNILDEVCDIFPSTYIHIGGDECPKTRWQTCPDCQQRMKDNGLKDEEELQSYTIRRIETFLHGRGRRLIGWDEILEGGLPPQATVMSWRGTEGGIVAAKEGHDVIMSPGTHCYLDHKQIDDPNETIGRPNDVLLLSKCYAYNPLPFELNEEESAHILGGQGNLWTEYMRNPAEVEYSAFPRLAALAEVFWSPQEVRDWDTFLPRLKEHCKTLSDKGVNVCQQSL